ncbi:MAG: hypothetical protein ACI81Y_001894 [Glaciecola sp.]
MTSLARTLMVFEKGKSNYRKLRCSFGNPSSHALNIYQMSPST